MNLLDLLTQSDQTDLERRFVEFHEKNPQVYAELLRLARLLKARGHKRIGMKMLFEQLRWQHALKTTDLSGFKLNNNYTAYYARMLMERNLDLVGFFETREVK
jgi:hypothetical protein